MSSMSNELSHTYDNYTLTGVLKIKNVKNRKCFTKTDNCKAE